MEAQGENMSDPLPTADDFARRPQMSVVFAIATNGMTWFMVRTLMCLALSHPDCGEITREIAGRFVHDLNGVLVQMGVLTKAELIEVERREREARPKEQPCQEDLR
jgi:hypothetical protein